MDVTRRESGTRIRKQDVVFLTAKLGYYQEITKSKIQSSPNVSAIRKQSKRLSAANLINSHNSKENTGAFAPESRESIKTNERLQNSVQRFTTALGTVFSPRRAVRVAPASREPKRKPIPVSRADFLPTTHRHERTARLKPERRRGKTKTTIRFLAYFSPLNRKTSQLSRSADEHCG